MRCGYCGKTYQRGKTHANTKSEKVIWTCPANKSFGKANCPNRYIPEKILEEKTKEVLGLDNLDGEILRERVSYIEKTDSTLTYYLKSGECIDTEWQYPSRSESWTPEMCEKVRQQNYERRYKSGQ